MTLNDRHIKNTSFTPSPAHTALKKAAKVIGLVIATIGLSSGRYSNRYSEVWAG